MENKRSRGRPKVDVDLEDVTELAAEGCSTKEIAAALGFSAATLFGRKDIKAAYDRGRDMLGVNLRHWQIEAAKGGNVQMLIWLGRQYLDQKDQKEKETPKNAIRDDALSASLRELAKKL